MTTEYFTRYGTPVTTRVYSVNASYGSAVTTIISACRRCGGAGGWTGWPGFTCYDCAGNGKRSDEVKVYTAKRNTQLDAAAAKRQAKREAEWQAKLAAHKATAATNREAFDATYPGLGRRITEAVAAGIGNGFMRRMGEALNERGQLTTAQATAAAKVLADHKAKAEAPHVGTVGERTTFTATLERTMIWEGEWGFTKVHFLACTETGATLVYKGSRALIQNERSLAENEGAVVQFTATVKAHDDYKGVPQTVVQRPTKVVVLTEAPQQEEAA